ncbi:peptide-methionine (S)-S-oxide reductase MsrA [Thiohalocapsa marina]|uniref:Peptide methionine sulfoxide reductase MsrA n=1 Tax=Thiohalocapsa marina TaxID=424902 RepID=A0A5M8F9W7_9GAMM|nr:peptide-methionine (S)-S-oxide reductase MsrA [Thiohalocapsa marina]KAA6181623.1 peptide-methionine (S)-S-oxide reductase MsrA [Thiohalocapsa marina]
MQPITPLLISAALLVAPLVAPPRALADTDSIVLGMGCFWGAEKRMAAVPGVTDVESGYAGGDAAQAGYRDVLNLEKALRRGRSTQRNHAEVVKVTFDTDQVSVEEVLIAFWENHDPTQGDRQGNDVGSNYRSAIYYNSPAQQAAAIATRDTYQQALSAADYGPITTEIAPLRHYNRAEAYHQDYLVKNPDGYCGLGGTQVAYPGQPEKPAPQRLNAGDLNPERQLIVFEAPDCPYCEQFRAEVLDDWRSEVPVASTLAGQPPEGWQLDKALFATPTMVLFEQGREVSRYTGYSGDKARFWQWLGQRILTPEQRRIAFEQGTERPFTGSHLDEKRPGAFVDPITGAPLFRTDTKFNSGTGWPSFFTPVDGAITLHEDHSHGMRRIEVRSASSGIHLGHVFNDGPPPTGERYCINGNVLAFVPD